MGDAPSTQALDDAQLDRLRARAADDFRGRLADLARERDYIGEDERDRWKRSGVLPAPVDGQRRHELILELKRREASPAGGSFLARYEPQRLLGEGAMARVYEAVDRQLFRRVALKVPREHLLLSAGGRERFHREAVAAAKLSHPNIVAVHDVGESAGRPYIIMERVDGGSLASALPAIDLPRAIEIVEKAARALHHVHREGIVHRDLKPANILLTSDGEPKIADFGLAHLLGGDTRMTAAGSPVGTPMYMAPEQVRPGGAGISARTDIHALGAILYELATGRAPFSGWDSSEIYFKILHEAPIPPRRLNPRVTVPLETVILKAMEKEADRRYATALDMAEDLARIRRGEPILAKAPGIADRVARWLRRRAAVVALGVLLSAAALALWMRDADRRSRLDQAQRHFAAGDEAERDGDDLRAEREWREAIRIAPEFVLSRFRLGRLLMFRAYLENQRMPWDADVPEPGAIALAGEAEREMAAAIAGGFSRRRVAQEMGPAMVAYVGTMDAREGELVRARLQAAIGRLRSEEGVEELHWLLGLVSNAPACSESYDQAIEINPGFWPAYMSRGTEHIRLRRLPEAIQDLGDALKFRPKSPFLLRARAGVHLMMANPTAAIGDLVAADRFEPRSPDTLAMLGSAKSSAGDSAGALRDWQRALEVAPAGWSGRSWVEQRMK